MWTQANLPINVGGLGISHCSNIINSCIVAGNFDCHDLAQKLLPESDISFLESQKCILKYCSQAGLEDHNFLPNPPKQHKLVSLIQTRIYNQLLSSSSLEQRARLRCLQIKGANEWLSAIPSEALGFTLTNNEFKVLVRLRLGDHFKLPSMRCPICAQQIDDTLSHGFICNCQGQLQHRHNVVRDFIFSKCKSAGLSPLLEVSNLLPFSRERPADIWIPSWNLNTPAAFDITITSVFTQPNFPKSAEDTNICFSNASAAKNREVLHLCQQQNILFVPLVCNNFGGWSPQSRQVFSQIISFLQSKQCLDRPQLVQEFYQGLSIAFQKATSQMFMRLLFSDTQD